MTPVVFTPADEPYLGRNLLHAFDELICSCLELNSQCAPKSHDRRLTDFQRALFKNPSAQVVWDNGWQYGKRPTLQQMFEFLNKDLLQGAFPSVKGFTHDLNSATHGDPLSARWNVVLRDGVPVFLPSKNLQSPGLADEICAETIPWLAATMGVE